MFPAMAHTSAAIRFRAPLSRPRQPADADWLFLVLPAAASSRLPSRAQVSVGGTLAGHPFQATLEPDGQGGHWMRVDAGLRKAAGVDAGQTVALSIAPLEHEPEPEVPDDLHQALRADPAALATWEDITPRARRDWIQWMTSGRKAETRAKRIASGCDMLAKGKRRACCFDRSGMYSKALSAPQAAP